eukprot:1154378-Pelagomonas_calceolata.AAC.5
MLIPSDSHQGPAQAAHEMQRTYICVSADMAVRHREGRKGQNNRGLEFQLNAFIGESYLPVLIK